MIKIFAVDIKNGKVVKAYAGARFNYKPLKIKNKDFSDANFVIKNAISIGIRDIYIADLDSIENRENNWHLIREIVETNQQINFFFDSGFNRVSKLRDFNLFLKKKKTHQKYFCCYWDREHFKFKVVKSIKCPI